MDETFEEHREHSTECIKMLFDRLEHQGQITLELERKLDAAHVKIAELEKEKEGFKKKADKNFTLFMEAYHGLGTVSDKLEGATEKPAPT